MTRTSRFHCCESPHVRRRRSRAKLPSRHHRPPPAFTSSSERRPFAACWYGPWVASARPAPGEEATARTVDATPALTPGAFALRVLEGPDAGQRVTLETLSPSPVLIGQSSNCTLRLSDRAASRRHVAMEVEGSQLRLRDLGSTNGTYVDGVRIV